MLENSLKDRSGDLPKSFSDQLRKKASKIVLHQNREEFPFLPSSSLQDEIALTMEQIARTHEMGQKIVYDLLQSECDVNTDLMQMEDRTPRYSPYRFPEREKMQRRLGDIAQERRRFVVFHATKMDALNDRLLSLLAKHKMLST